MLRIKKLTRLLMPMILCATLASCAHSQSPIVVVKGVDYDDGKANNEPTDRSTWMWITYETAKRQLHWINHSGR